MNSKYSKEEGNKKRNGMVKERKSQIQTETEYIHIKRENYSEAVIEGRQTFE